MNGDDACEQKAVKEKDLEKAFVRAMNYVIGSKQTFFRETYDGYVPGA